ncbi:hypothetical protein HOB10_03765 [Candidatus Parcubacteria bacterium]|jgi:hypothetical protein|nr:hypothetical protein [Candidatus Parcubacteria bacterium]
MSKEKKKIVVLFAGGTCLLDKQGHILTIKEKTDIDSWLQQMPELNILADIKPILISGEDEIITSQIWEKLALTILDNFVEADGFVVVTKIDQLIETSLALDFMLQHFQKTIITTSSYVSGTSFVDKKETINTLKSKFGGLGLRANLINALQVADQPLPGPALMFGSRLIPAITTIYQQPGDINFFSSLDGVYWGKVDFGVNVKSGLSYSSHKSKIYRKIAADVLVLDDIPGVPWNFAKEQAVKYKAIFIKVKPFQALDTDKQKQIGQWKQPVVLYNQQTVMDAKGVVAISGCTEQAAIVKTMWAVAHHAKLADFKVVMQQNIIGEFIN